MLVNIAIVYVTNGYMFYALTYNELMPDYICPDTVKTCNNEAKCADPLNVKINYDSTRTLDNWVPRLDLECK